MKIYWDLDGVLRDLNKAVWNKIPDVWNYSENGENIYDKIRKNYKILLEAPPTKYLKVALKFPFIEILTHQPEEWKKYTEEWVEKHLGSVAYNIIYINNIKSKTLYLDKESCLIDDYPYFSNYNNIILIDRPYNRNTRANIRIKSPEDLERILKIILNK